MPYVILSFRTKKGDILKNALNALLHLNGDQTQTLQKYIKVSCNGTMRRTPYI